MAAPRYRFRLGDPQSIALRFDPIYNTELRCRARGRVGAVHWATQAFASDAQVQAFMQSLDGLVGQLRGEADLDVQGSGGSRVALHVTVEPRGTILTEYQVAGVSGGVRRTPWQASGSFVCYHHHYFTRVSRGTPVPG